MENHHQTPPPPQPQGRGLRGRPAGSKNKPKQPVIINRENPNSLTSHVMEISPGHDMVKALSDFATDRHRGICILSASGSLMNIALRQPALPQQLHQQKQQISQGLVNVNPSVVNFTGMFEILSMSGAFLPPPAPPSGDGITVLVSGGQGQVVGGKVVGPLMTAGTVVVVASSFANAVYDKLPLITEQGKYGEDRNVTVAVPGTAVNVPTPIPQPTVDRQLPMTPAGGTTAGLFHGYGANAPNVMPAEELWGAALAGPSPF